MKLLTGLLVAFYLAVPLASGFAPTPITWDGSACASGLATVTTTAVDAQGLSYQVITPDVQLPVATLAQVFPNLPPTSYTVTATVRYDSGTQLYSAAQTVTGLGDAPVPSPTATPTPTPSPTPQPGQQTTDCTKRNADQLPTAPMTDAAGHVWTIASGWTLRDGAYSWQPGSDGGAAASELKIIGGVIYAHDLRVGTAGWWKWNERGTQVGNFWGTWTSVGATEPVCGTPTPSPTPTPTPTPSPTPLPVVDLAPVLTALEQQRVMLGQISTALAGLVPSTVTCSITGMGAYANGDQKLTVRCVPSGFATGQSIRIIK